MPIPRVNKHIASGSSLQFEKLPGFTGFDVSVFSSGSPSLRPHWVQGSGFRVQGSGFRVQGSGSLSLLKGTVNASFRV